VWIRVLSADEVYADVWMEIRKEGRNGRREKEKYKKGNGGMNEWIDKR
jgi:hypothetical protein